MRAVDEFGDFDATTEAYYVKTSSQILEDLETSIPDRPSASEYRHLLAHAVHAPAPQSSPNVNIVSRALGR